MDLTRNKPVIINASNGAGWYPTGTQRLKRSLNHVGWAGDTRLFTWWPHNGMDIQFDTFCPYNIKAAALLNAFIDGFTHVLWVDCSGWAINDPMPLFDIINQDGYYFWSSGYNAAQTCSDKCLDYFQITRDHAEKMPDVSSGVFGLNLESEIGFQFFVEFIEAAVQGVFKGSREHDNQSSDPRFLFHRQDQSACSVIAGKMGLKIHDPNIHVAYWSKKLPESVIFAMRGI